jgi:formamidopyrimidine-DNA glycosylase
VPELPEVETIRRDLEPLVRGRRIVDLEVDPATLPLLAGAATSLEALNASLVGRTIDIVGRRGKYLLFGLDDGRTLVAHLRMTGRWLWRKREDPAEAFERAWIALDDGHDLRWSDVRKFGTWRVVEDTRQLFTQLGPEPIDQDFTLKRFRAALAGRTAPIKSVLLDQRRIAGLGNIYVDEALFEAGIRPEAPADELSPRALKRLHAATRSVLERGIENRGASFRDYVDASGNEGTQHMYVQVFRRTGKPCYRCGRPIQRTVVGGRSTHYCARCQRFPRRSRATT